MTPFNTDDSTPLMTPFNTDDSTRKNNICSYSAETDYHLYIKTGTALRTGQPGRSPGADFYRAPKLWIKKPRFSFLYDC